MAADSLRSTDHKKYDVVFGNPPWGAELEGWSPEQIRVSFPACGEERDSYAIFIIRAWQMLKDGGVLAFIVPNSWLTVEGYETFRSWLLRSFDVVSITNVWKIFSDVNHDATMVIAKKRSKVIESLRWNKSAQERALRIQSVGRGRSEDVKLKQLAQLNWEILHETTHGFQYRQPKHRFEVVFGPKISDELDKIANRCSRLDEIADVTVGIQVYHHTKVSKKFIRDKGFHALTKASNAHYPFIESNDVERYFDKSSTTKWLEFSDLLRDKRSLLHYAQPRILVQQIFWRRLSAVLQEPEEPYLYLNTLFSVSTARGLPLGCILGLLNSRFVSSSYERRANRLFGDKFPKVSKADIASTPIPRMRPLAAAELSKKALSLQSRWQAFREALLAVDAALRLVSADASLALFEEFWTLTETEFLDMSRMKLDVSSPKSVRVLRQCYVDAKSIVDTQWHKIIKIEEELEVLVRKAYGMTQEVYENLAKNAPEPSIYWALRR